MIELLDLTPLVTKLIAECPAFDGRVFETIPDDELTIDLHQSPCAFVYLSSDDSEPNQLGKGKNLTQRTTEQITVEIILRRTASRLDQFNNGSVQLIKAYRTEIFNALLAWRPDGAIRSLQHENGRVLSKQKKQIKFADTFSTQSMMKGKR